MTDSIMSFNLILFLPEPRQSAEENKKAETRDFG